MTIQNPPIFVQAGSHPAEDVRRWIAASTNDIPGVVLSWQSQNVRVPPT